MQNISMSKLQKQQIWNEPQKILIKNIFIKVKFACRCYLEYQINQQVQRTKQIKVDSKSHHYEFNQSIHLPKKDYSNTTKKHQQLRIFVKLLSGKGLSFTVGFIDINQSTITKSRGAFELKISQTQDIEARCTFQALRPTIEEQFKTPNRENTDLNYFSSQNINQTNSSKSKNSKLQMEFQELKEDYYKLKDKFSKYQSGNPTQNFHFSQSRKSECAYKRSCPCCDSLKQKNETLQMRSKELEKQLMHNRELFNKQKDILRIFQHNLKQKNLEYEQLKKKHHEICIKSQELYKSNCVLQQEKIKYLMNQLKTEKQRSNIGQYMAHMFQQIFRVIQNIFKQRISNLTSIAQSKQLSKHDTKRQSLTSPTSPIKKLFYSTQFKKCQEPVQDVSISGGDFEGSQIKSMNVINCEIGMKNILKDLKPKVGTLFSEQCIQTVKTYCFKIQKIVNQSVQRLFKKIMELTSYNQACKRKFSEDKQEYENNQQSLIDYLEQLQQGLETQLQIVKQKDIILERDEGIIHTLNEIILEKQRRICQIEEAYDKLQDQKNEIKAQLHQNNYLYAIKEQQFIRKIYELQTGFEKPEPVETQHQPTRLKIIQRKATVYSDNLEQQINAHYREFDEMYENEVIYVSPKLSTLNEQNQQIHPERNQFTLYEDTEEAKLRHTMLKNHRLTLVSKLREQMAYAENAQSIDQKDQQQQREEKVIEEEFLKVLV